MAPKVTGSAGALSLLSGADTLVFSGADTLVFSGADTLLRDPLVFMVAADKRVSIVARVA